MKPGAALPRVGVVILNYNCRELLEECIASVLGQTYPNITPLFIDNGSRDGSVDLVRKRFPGVGVLPIGHNIGFASLNIGIRLALEDGCDLLMYLDSDARLDEAAITTLVDFLGDNPACGIAGPLHLEYSTLEPRFLGAVLDMRTLKPRVVPFAERPLECDYLGNALVRREVLERLQFDERFFTYYSDSDLCLRARALGYRVMGVPAAKIYSLEGHTSSKVPGLVGYVFPRNRLLFASKHVPRRNWTRVVPLTILDSARALSYWILASRFRDAALVPVGLASGLLILLTGREPGTLRELAASGMRNMVEFVGSESYGDVRPLNLASA